MGAILIQITACGKEVFTASGTLECGELRSCQWLAQYCVEISQGRQGHGGIPDEEAVVEE